VPRFVVPAAIALAAALAAQTPFFALSEVRPGMRGVGRTVFSGNKIEEFQVEIIGVLDNIGPKESLILARLSGGPLEHAGVMQGMSGSPVYIDGKLAGAVAMAFSYSKDPICGIRPIEEMMGRGAPAGPSGGPSVALLARSLFGGFSKPRPVLAGEARMLDIATPMAFGGFSRKVVDTFAGELRALGLEPLQGVAAGARLGPGLGNPADLKPGSMISVELMAGDLSVGADGTVTYIDGGKVWAFGHRFLGVGPTALPFARAEVVTVLPALNSSFKLSSPKEWMGLINQDGETAISGELGKLPALAPVTISVSRAGRRIDTYNMRMVDHPLLSPLLIQMAVSGALDATERSVGASSVRITGEVEFANAPAPVKIDNFYAMDSGASGQASVNAAVPAAFVMQSGFPALALKKVEINLDVFEQNRSLAVDGITVSRRSLRPGEDVTLTVSLAGQGGVELTRRVTYQAPIGAQPGPLYFTVSDAATANLADFRQVLSATPRTPAQAISIVNALHPNTRAYVRVWRADPAFQLEGVDLPDPPASAALIFGAQAAAGGIAQTRNAKIAGMEIDTGGRAVTGSKTIQVEIKE
jgi:hypothetical protein